MDIADALGMVCENKMQTCIFGCGIISKGVTYPFLKDNGIIIDFFVDNKIPENTVVIDGISTKSPEYLRKIKDEIFVFIGVSNKYQDEIKRQLRDYGISDEQVLCVNYDFTDKFVQELENATPEEQEHYHRLYDDKSYLETLYQAYIGRRPDLDHPKTFNEKLQWLKLNDRKELYSTMVDKYAVKDYVSSIVSDLNPVKTIGVWNSYDEIDFDKFPDSFVLKCTHDSGSVLVVKDKSKFDSKSYRERFDNAMKRNLYYRYREWPYKNVAPRIMAEEYLEVEGKEALPVYKFFCFNGEPKIIQTIENDKRADEVIDYYDTEWKLLDLRQNYPNSKDGMKRPDRLRDMLKYAEILSQGHPFIRVDFYEIDGKVYFSEFTFFSDAGFSKFDPEKWDRILGEYIKLPIDD